ncbi:unnamed protein product [Effrenium voratum]|nr:unnamed protein product [Effrenium voratum]CAJ1450700.1 unnamed protein product [Effrenium voratum]|mmetsp:Transcript_37385/g.89369  ORF Transcript_37385/g.89369 Transcript_37385/m.89369 type:complete len:103 (-) Transcript_37385:165-473(-)
MSLLNSLFGRYEEVQQSAKDSCTNIISASIQKRRRPDGAFDLDTSSQEQCWTGLTPSTSTTSEKGKPPLDKPLTPNGGSWKGRAEVLMNFNHRYELYDRLVR